MEEPYNYNTLAPLHHAGRQFGHTLLWDGITFINQDVSQVNQCGCVGHTGINSTPKLIPQVFNGIQVRSADRDCRISSWCLSPLRLLSVMTSLVFQGRCWPTSSYCPHQKLLPYWCSNQCAPRFQHTIQLLQADSGLIIEHKSFSCFFCCCC